jgi:Zn-dependent protease
MQGDFFMNKQTLKIKISFSGAIMALALFLTHSYISLAALLAAFLHELGHIIAAKICKIDLGELKLGIFGASLTSKVMLCSYKKEIFLCLAGPLVNLTSVLILFPFCKFENSFNTLFISTSLFLGLLNLLPIYEFDGGRILYCLLSPYLSLTAVTTVIKTISFILIFILWSLSVYLLLRLSSSVSLFVFSLSLFSKIFLSQKKDIY